MKEIEQAILDIIEELYCCKYIGKIEVKLLIDYSFPGDVIPYGFLASIGLNKDERPLTIACDGNKELFLKYVRKELLNRHLEHIDYFTAIQLHPYIDNPDANIVIESNKRLQLQIYNTIEELNIIHKFIEDSIVSKVASSIDDLIIFDKDVASFANDTINLNLTWK